MNLKTLQKNWNEFGVKDPLWAILTADDVKNNKWDLKKFFKTGVEEIDGVLKQAKKLGLAPKKSGIALDFGCGVGRLSLAMAEHFKEVHGVDIAASMIEKANEMKRKRGNVTARSIHYHLNEKDDLSLFEDGKFDFIYSNITLQHMRNEYSKKYMKEFVRILSQGGLLVFQIPSHLNEKNSKRYKFKYWLMTHAPEPVKNLYRQLKYKGAPVMEMHPVGKGKVLSLLENFLGKGNYKVEAVKDNFAGDNMDSYTYFVNKKM